jgi:hypothetical protein
MVEDPAFVPSESTDEVDGVLDVSHRTAEICDGSDGTAPANLPTCVNMYCGDGDGCAESVSGTEGCVCSDNKTARAIQAPNGSFSVACTTLDIDLHAGNATPCAGVDCGLGTCVPVNDRPTCACDAGAVAVAEFGAVRCEDMVGGVVDPAAITSPFRPAESRGPARSTGCAAPSGNRIGNGVDIALWLATPLLISAISRRRRAKNGARPDK